ncbi:MAG TPA: LuxR C-terminal-related transcriptional regulator [Trebonia sp.]|nr:LuxR C-terminal-related transcriptional regulator [Trebonia sp.]
MTREVGMVLVGSRGQVTGARRLGLLPAEATSFVGRTIELAGITALLGTARMVTVVGPAGVGKTRLSLRAAALAAEQFTDGVWLADLAGISDPDLLEPTVAAVLGLPDGNDAALGAALLGYLRHKRLLLVLDTCEHLVDACAAFADTVLRAAPGVTLLATSRQPLDAQGEHAFPLPPLPAEDDATDLFAQRAAAVLPGFTVTPQNRADVVRLCQRLDGVPLAIELAAVRLRALPLAELASQLESGIRMLTVSRRGTSPRHQTLRAAVEWSYRLCTPAERALWERLSVFAGTFDVSGAEQVCADDALPRAQIVHALVGLVDKSVVLRDATDPSRYRLLGALREFGADRLAETSEPEYFLDRLAARCVAKAKDLDERLRGSTRLRDRMDDGTEVNQVATFRALQRDYENVRAVLGYALGAQEPSADPSAALLGRWRLGAELAVRLCGYWQISGLLDEGRQWLGRVVDLFPEPARERSAALGARGRLATLQGDLGTAVADINESIRLAEAAEHGAELAARGYLYLNLALTFTGQHTEALAAAETARQRLVACGYRIGVAGLEAQLAHLYQMTGDVDEAIERCDRGLALLGQSKSARTGGERWVSGYLYLVSGLALAQRPGREHTSAKALCRALTAKHELGDVVGTAYAVEALAWLAARREQYERTAWLIGAADQLWNRTGRRLSGVALMEESRQRTVMMARRALGERRFTAAYAHGAALGLDAVVREAAYEIGEAGPRGGDAGDPVATADGADGGAAPGLLTRREREIAELVASGLSNREIATRLFISKRTVDAHVEHIFGKLEISSRVQLTVLLQDQAPRARATWA